MKKILASILVVLTIITSIIFLIKTINNKNQSQKLTGTIHIIKFKNNYTSADFFNELHQLNPVAYASYESDYFIPFITTHLQRETILMIPVFRENTDVDAAEFSIITPTQLYFELPLRSYEQHNYPIDYIDLNLPSFAMQGDHIDCKSKNPKNKIIIDNQNYTALIEFNIMKCNFYDTSNVL